ncbi:MAG: hypothetical protein HZA29_04820 [Candidatus Omnitrophica bacterium]|nr:hypothetical protein [Candidatus Omnitrophota bacterium]
MTIYSLDQILKLIIIWEERLDSFYDMMEEYLKDKRSRETAFVLQRRQVKALEMLKGIDPKEYAHVEYVRNVSDYPPQNIMSHLEIPADSSPRDVLEAVLTYEEELEKFYTHLRDVLAYAKSKELFDMLIQFKMGQIKEIRACLDSYDLAL